MHWAHLHEWQYPELALLFAIPNGGYRRIETASRLKAEGVKAGVPDLFLPVARSPWNGLFIEMKTKKGVLTGPQRYWQRALKEQMYRHEVCRGFEAARDTLIGYLREEKYEH